MSPTPPDALLFVSPGCAHCPAVSQALDELVRQGVVGRLTVVDAAAHSEQAAEHGVRTVPWLRLGPFTFTGAHGPAELRVWAGWASTQGGAAYYVEHLLKQGNYSQAKAFVAEDPHRLRPLLAILAAPEAGIDVRLGVSALLEAYTNAPALQALLPQLAELSRHADRRVRADACHLLGRTGSAAAREPVAACLDDADREVREIAQEAMEELETADQSPAAHAG